MVELLAPAGSVEALRAAVESGADAVYLAGDHFGARAYAGNFDADGLREAIRYAHLRDVRIHVTVNTIVRDEELPLLREYLRFLDEVRADAALVQDLGVARMAREVAPHLPLHASTQMSVSNLESVLALAHIGFSRAVLAREMSLEEIRHICKHSPIEIETFMHGALCVCYSGQCLMSSMIGRRSGNRGRCAQPCRLPYTLVDADGKDVLKEEAGDYLLSPRDFNTIDALPELIKAGVTSLKIEGRMKRPEYVHTVVDAYRKAIHSFYANHYTVLKETRDNLTQIFNRDFTTAYLFGKPGKNMMSDRRPNNRGLLVGRVADYDREKERVTVKLQTRLVVGDEVNIWVKVGGRVQTKIENLFTKKGSVQRAEAGEIISFQLAGRISRNDRIFKIFDAALMEEAKAYYSGGAPIRRLPVKGEVFADIGRPLEIRYEDELGTVGIGKTDFIAESAKRRPLTKETVEKQVGRLGSSPFALTSLTTNLGKNVMVPVSEINEARRRAVDTLEKARLSKITREPGRYDDEQIVRKASQKQAHLMVAVDTLAKTKTALDAGADSILFGGESYTHTRITAGDYQKAAELARTRGARIDFSTPRIVKDSMMKAMEKLVCVFEDIQPDAIHVHNIGMLSLVRRLTSLPIHADYSLISFNKETLAFLKDYGVSEATASPELNVEQLAELVHQSVLPLTAIVHGRLELMISAYCIMGSFLGGVDRGKCSLPCVRGTFSLKDRKDVSFPLRTDEFCHMHVLNSKTLSMLPHAGKLIERGIKTLRIEAKAMTESEIQKIVTAYKERMKKRGEDTEEEKAQIARLEGRDITRGHYFRGVL